MDWLHTFPQLSTSLLQKIKSQVDNSFLTFSATHGDAIESFFQPLLKFLIFTERLLVTSPWIIILTIICAFTYWLSKNVRLAIMVCLCFSFIGLIGLWQDTMKTLSIILVATFLCISLGIPIGTLMHTNKRIRSIVYPILDMMQTIPTFVYLIPIIVLMGIGKVPGLIAVCIYAISPVIRLTCLGLLQVSTGYLEAGRALGLTKMQVLFLLKYPLSIKSIMVGINQTIMMSLAMVVIASMIGVSGLGSNILKAINNQYITSGLLNGLAIVLLAIMLDRIFQSITKK